MGAQDTLPPLGAEMSSKNTFRMIDVGSKNPTARRARAQGCIHLSPSTLNRIRNHNVPKGDVIAIAEVAGIMAAKKTHELLPLCHPLPIEAVRVQCEFLEDHSIQVACEVATTAKTGVEMEALVGVSTALLTIYDLTKGIDSSLFISDIFLCEKEGGASGKWVHPDPPSPKPSPASERGGKTLSGVRAAVLTVSDRRSKGLASDKSGTTIVDFLKKQGAELIESKMVPDEIGLIQGAIHHFAKELSADWVVITGGTGLGQRDVTPEALAPLWTKPIPGIGELLREQGSKYTPFSWLSRSAAGLVDKTLVVLLPGSPRAVLEGLEALKEVLPHAIHIAKGGDHE